MNNPFWNEQQEVERLEEKIDRLKARVKQLKSQEAVVWLKKPDTPPSEKYSIYWGC